jgi:hypothetical protein
MSSISFNNGVMIKLGGEPIFKFEDSLRDEDDDGVSDMNCTLCLVKPLILFKIFLSLESCVTYAVNMLFS